jgi:hypothetical protein
MSGGRISKGKGICVSLCCRVHKTVWVAEEIGIK